MVDLLSGRNTRAAAETLAAEALLDLLDPGLEDCHVSLQLGEVTLEDLTPAALIREPGLDSPQGLRDRLILLLEPLESPIDLVEVTEDLSAELAEQSREVTVHSGEATVHLEEVTVDLGEATVDLGEPLAEELDELLILGGRHARGLP